MRFKLVPEPPDDLAAVAAILEAVPETAGAVDDCCARLVAETRVEDRSEAEAWLLFLRALELVTADEAGYRRIRSESTAEGDRSFALEADRDRLRETFRARVDGADAVLEALDAADEPLSAAAVAEARREERAAAGRETRFDRFETDRVRRILEWAVLLGSAERTADGDRYRSVVACE